MDIAIDFRMQKFTEFVSAYESVVETICDAANIGVTASLEARFALATAAYRNRYSEIGPSIGGFLPLNSPNHFASLGAYDSLEELLESDQGELIGRIMVTRDALDLYTSHLESLSAVRA